MKKLIVAALLALCFASPALADYSGPPTAGMIEQPFGGMTGSGLLAGQTSPSFITPSLGVAGASSLALGGCTIGTNLFCVNGPTSLGGATTLTTSQSQISGGSVNLAFTTVAALTTGEVVGATNITAGTTISALNGSVRAILTGNGVQSASGQKNVTVISITGCTTGMQFTDITTPAAIGAGNLVTGASGSTITVNTNLAANTGTADTFQCDPVVVLSAASTATIASGASINFYANTTTLGTGGSVVVNGGASVNGNLKVGGTASLAGVTTVTGGTVTTNIPALSITQTWNNAAITFDAGLLLNIINMASSSQSALVDFQVGGISAFMVQQVGNIIIPHSSSAGLSWGTSAAPALSSATGTVLLVTPDQVQNALSVQKISSAYSVGLANNVAVGWTGSTAPNAVLTTGISQDSTAGVVDFDTSTRGNKLGSWNATNGTLSGTFTNSGVTTGTVANAACLTSGGVLILDAANCIVSSARFKKSIDDMGGAIRGWWQAMRLRPVGFNRKQETCGKGDVNCGSRQLGFIAEEVNEVDPRATIYEPDGKTIRAYRPEAISAIIDEGMHGQAYLFGGLILLLVFWNVGLTVGLVILWRRKSA